MTSFPINEGTPINTKLSLITHIHTNPEHCLAHPWNPVYPKQSRFVSQLFLPIPSPQHVFSRPVFVQEQPCYTHIAGSEHESHRHQAPPK